MEDSIHLIQQNRREPPLSQVLFSYTTLTLLSSNIFTIFIAIWQQWSLGSILLIYWCQSVIIGYFNFLRIKNLKKFSTEGFRMNDKPVQPTEKTKNEVATFFALHFGFFHFGYAIFLSSEILEADIIYIAMCTALFFSNHFHSFNEHRHETNKIPNIGTLMFYPYFRIIPMHLIIIFATVVEDFNIYGIHIPLVGFLILKTLADTGMHIIEHKYLR